MEYVITALYVARPIRLQNWNYLFYNCLILILSQLALLLSGLAILCCPSRWPIMGICQSCVQNWAHSAFFQERASTLSSSLKRVEEKVMQGNPHEICRQEQQTNNSKFSFSNTQASFLFMNLESYVHYMPMCSGKSNKHGHMPKLCVTREHKTTEYTKYTGSPSAQHKSYKLPFKS